MPTTYATVVQGHKNTGKYLHLERKNKQHTAVMGQQ